MKKPDEIVSIGRSMIQHGPWNDRIYLMKLHTDEVSQTLCKILDLAKTNGYSKIFAKVPHQAYTLFNAQGFEEEASIPSFFDKDAVHFMSKFFSQDRNTHNDYQSCTTILNDLQTNTKSSELSPLPPGWHLSKCTKQDSQEMASIYKNVFATYPFPIDQPSYILETMEESVCYYGIRNESNQLVALCSAEMDLQNKSAEMTDFATLPEARGKHCARRLLIYMEKQMKEKGIKTAFTIARAASRSMNTVFFRNNYTYSGTLKKNTNIGGTFEDMNVWYRPL